jgi:radical SAM-linked protein
VEFYSLPDISLPELVAYLNQFMTDEIFVTDIEIMPDGFKNSMSLLIAADYMVVEKEAGVFPENWQEKWLSFMEQQEIVIEKKTKKSVKEVDIKPHILAWDFSLASFAEKNGENYGTLHCDYEGNSLFMRLTSGSETNIKPELVMQAFYAFCENELEPYSYQIHRMQIIFKKKGE